MHADVNLADADVGKGVVVALYENALGVLCSRADDVAGGNVRVGRAAVDAELDVNSDRSVFDGNAADDNFSAAVNRNAVCHARAIPNGLRLVFSSNRTAYGISNLSVNHKTVSLPCLDAPTVAAQDFVVFNDSSCRTVHFHEQIEILQVRSGCMSCTVNDADLTLSQGQTLLINSNIPHRIKSQTENSEVTVLDFDIYDWIAQSDMENAQYPYSFLSRHTTVPYRIWNSTDAEELISHIYRIAEETEAKRPAYRMFVKAYITWIAAYLWRENFLTDIDLGKKPELNRVLPAIRFIDEHYHQPLTLDQISRAVLLDRSYLCKLFKRATDTTLTDYINYVRVRRAAEMLRTTDRSSMEIAYTCGFASQQYFNRIFKREFGQTPKAFRISQRID